MSNCKCGHGKILHDWNIDYRERVGGCNYDYVEKNIHHPCLCDSFTESSKEKDRHE